MSVETVKFRDIAAQIREELLAPSWVVGRQLDPEVVYMERFGVSRVTVRNALSRLEHEGLIRRGRGKRGVLLRKPPDPQKQRRGFNCGLVGNEHIVDSARSDFPGVAVAMLAALSQWDTSLSIYPYCDSVHPAALHYIADLWHRNMVDGFLLGHFPDRREIQDFLVEREVPFVHIVGTSEVDPPTPNDRLRPAVWIDEPTSLRKVIAWLRGVGATRVVLLGTEMDYLPKRTDALFADACAEIGMDYAALRLDAADFDALHRAVVAYASPATCLVASNQCLPGLDYVVSMLKLRVPAQARVLLFKHHTPDWGVWEKKYPVLQTPTADVGRAAADLIRAQLLAKETGAAFERQGSVVLERRLTLPGERNSHVRE